MRITAFGDKDASISIYGTVESANAALAGNGSQSLTGKFTFNVYDGAILTANGADSTYTAACGIYQPDTDITLNIYGGTITSESFSAVEIRAGIANIEGGTLESKATAFSSTPNADGPTTKGAALAISQHTYKPEIKVNISGGSFICADNGKQIAAVNTVNCSPDDLAKVSVSSVWNGDATTAWYNESASEFDLYFASDLAGLAKLVNEGISFEGKTIKLNANIDLASLEWSPINGFNGKFDGQNHTISNLTINKTEQGNYGLFGEAGDSIEIINLNLSRAKISVTGLKSFVGGFIGLAHDLKISGCSIDSASTITASGDKGVGGLVGKVALKDIQKDRVVISDCHVSASLQGNRAGGMVGYVADGNARDDVGCIATVSKCSFDGKIDASASLAGSEHWAGGIFAQYTNGYDNIGRIRITDCEVKTTDIKGGTVSSFICSTSSYYALNNCKINGEAVTSPVQIGGNHYIPEQKVGINGVLYYTEGTKGTPNPTELHVDSVEVKIPQGDGYELVDGTLDASAKWYKISNACIDDKLYIRLSGNGSNDIRYNSGNIPTVKLMDGYKLQFSYHEDPEGFYNPGNWEDRIPVYRLNNWRIVPNSTLESDDWLDSDTKNLGAGYYCGMNPTNFVDSSKYTVNEYETGYWSVTPKSE